MTPNSYSMNVLMQRASTESRKKFAGSESFLTYESLAEAAGSGQVVTTEKLKALAIEGGMNVDNSEDRERFAQALAPLLEQKVNDPVVMSAAYAFLVIELEAVSDVKDLPMSDALVASKRAEEIRQALDIFDQKKCG